MLNRIFVAYPYRQFKGPAVDDDRFFKYNPAQIQEILFLLAYEMRPQFQFRTPLNIKK
jgi:hypothetical protein